MLYSFDEPDDGVQPGANINSPDIEETVGPNGVKKYLTDPIYANDGNSFTCKDSRGNVISPQDIIEGKAGFPRFHVQGFFPKKGRGTLQITALKGVVSELGTKIAGWVKSIVK